MNAPARKSGRSRWPGGPTVLALSSMRDGGRTPAAAFDRPIVEESHRAPVEIARTPTTRAVSMHRAGLRYVAWLE
jgi:hypothetical protein